MNRTDFYLNVKLISVIVVTLFLSGCYSLDQNEFCPFGKGASQEVDYSSPVIVSSNNNIISTREQKALLASSRHFSSRAINETYDSAEYLCENKELSIEQYQQLQSVANVFIHSGAVFPWAWTENGKLQRDPLHLALEDNDVGHIITGTFCVVGICDRMDHDKFCKNKERAYLKNEKLVNKLIDYYVSNKGYKITYPNTKTVSYCKGPKW